jgi:hypothetical protein
MKAAVRFVAVQIRDLIPMTQSQTLVTYVGNVSLTFHLTYLLYLFAATFMRSVAADPIVAPAQSEGRQDWVPFLGSSTNLVRTARLVGGRVHSSRT